jgi:hypothetical protein
MTEIDQDDVSILNEFDCESCEKGITLIQFKGKYMTAKSAIVPALFGAGGYSLGGSAGIAALGTAASASWPLAAVGALVGSSAVYWKFEAKASPFRAGMKPTNSIQPPTMA